MNFVWTWNLSKFKFSCDFAFVFIKLKMKERFFTLYLWLMIFFNKVTLFEVKTEPIRSQSFVEKRNVFINIVKRPDTEPFLVSNRLDESNIWRIFYNLLRIVVKRYSFSSVFRSDSFQGFFFPIFARMLLRIFFNFRFNCYICT